MQNVLRSTQHPITLSLILCLLLVGCGFQLKGSNAAMNNSSLSGRDVAVMSAQPRSELTVALTQQLKLELVNVVAPGANTLILKIGAEGFVQRNLSLTAQARSAEVELTMSTAIELLQDGKTLVENTEASVVRQFLNDPRNVVGKTEELRLLKEEMRRDLAAQITRRVSHSLDN